MDNKIIHREVNIIDADRNVNFDNLILTADNDYNNHLNSLDYSNYHKMIEIFAESIYEYDNGYRLSADEDGLIDELELELRFFQEIFGGVSNTLSKFQFETIIKNLHNLSESANNLKELDETHELDITFHRDNYIDFHNKFSNLRYSIQGKQNIIKYCKSNILPHDKKILFKNKLNINTSDEEQIQRYYTKNLKKTFTKNNIDLYEVRTRLGGKLELEYNKEMNKFNSSNISNSYISAKIIEANSLLREINKYHTQIGSDQNMYKTFRLKTRKSFLFGENIRIDLTKVKNSKKDVNAKLKYDFIPTKSFIKGNINSQTEQYEMEIELINLQSVSKEELIKLINRSINIFKYITQFVSEMDKFTYSFIQDDVKHIYNTLIDTIIGSRISSKIAEKSTASLSKIENEFKKKRGRFTNEKYRFISPSVVSINMSNLHNDNVNSITKDFNYCVTDKADGLGHILFKVGLDHMSAAYKTQYNYLKDRVFLIDNNLVVKDIDFKCMKKTDNFAILLNGEYLNYNKNHEPLNEYLIYDAYYYNKDICSLNLMNDSDDSDTRLSFAKKFVKNYLLTPLTTDINSRTLIKVKEFYKASSDSNIFQQTKKIWDNKDAFSYHLDGVIYTPTNCPVNFTDTGKNKEDYFIFQNQTWYKNIKWKPAHDNTIDFLIRFKKEVLIKKENIDITRNVIKIINDDEYIIGNLYNKDNNKPVSFSPKLPDLGDVSSGLFKGEYTNGIRSKLIIKDVLNNLVEDNTIVECSYTNFNTTHEDYIDNKNMRFTILHTRHDKTYSHRIAMDTQNKNMRHINKLLSILSVKNEHQLTFFQKKYINKHKYLLYSRGLCHRNSTIRDLIQNLPKIKLFYSKKDNVTNGIKFNYGNSKHVADRIWETIHNPITVNMITTGLGIPTRTSELDKYYNNSLTIKRGHSKMINMQNFHNFVKKNLLIKKAADSIIENRLKDGYIAGPLESTDIDLETLKISKGTIYNAFIYNNYLIFNITSNKTVKTKKTKKTSKILTLSYKLNSDPSDVEQTIDCTKIKSDTDNIPELSILDLCCGKGGDIFKWIPNKFKLCIGLDLFEDNIHNKYNGAFARYNKYLSGSSSQTDPSIEFYVADCSKKIYETPYNINTNAFYKSEDNFNKFNEKKPVNGFDVVSIMFALHYFFKNESELDNLIDNISNNLKQGGYLIGICFDGKQIYDFLSTLDKGDSNDGNTISNELIWKITKNFNNISNNFAANDNSTLGMSISVFVRSINKTFEEFLVNFNYFKQKLKAKSIMEVKSSLITEEILSKSRKPLQEYEKDFSKLNRYFVFKKI